MLIIGSKTIDPPRCTSVTYQLMEVKPAKKKKVIGKLIPLFEQQCLSLAISYPSNIMRQSKEFPFRKLLNFIWEFDVNVAMR